MCTLFSSSVERTTITVVPRLRNVAVPEDEARGDEVGTSDEIAEWIESPPLAPRADWGSPEEEEVEEEEVAL
jgi:hypothetical protein